MQSQVSDTIAMMTGKIRAHSPLPIAVGFGISNADQARQVAQHAEAIVVGSAIVNRIAEHGKSPDLVERVVGFVKTLAEAVRSVR
jgi:tryptophan synthase alpha chain